MGCQTGLPEKEIRKFRNQARIIPKLRRSPAKKLFKADPDEDDQRYRCAEVGDDLEEADVTGPATNEADDERAGGDRVHPQGEDDRHQAEGEGTLHPPVDAGIDDKERDDEADVDERDHGLELLCLLFCRLLLGRVLGFVVDRVRCLHKDRYCETEDYQQDHRYEDDPDKVLLLHFSYSSCASPGISTCFQIARKSSKLVFIVSDRKYMVP